jgi:hypothetical protein
MRVLLTICLIFFALQVFADCEGIRDYHEYNGDWRKFTPEAGCMGTGEIVVSDGMWAIQPKELQEDNIHFDELTTYVLYLESQIERIVVSGESQKGKITIKAIFHPSRRPTLTASYDGEITPELKDKISLFLPKVMPLHSKKDDASFNFDYKVNWRSKNKMIK